MVSFLKRKCYLVALVLKSKTDTTCISFFYLQLRVYLQDFLFLHMSRTGNELRVIFVCNITVSSLRAQYSNIRNECGNIAVAYRKPEQ